MSDPTTTPRPAAPRPAAPPEPLRAFVFVARLLRLTLRSWWGVLPWLLVPALLLTLPAIPFEFHDFQAQLEKPLTLGELPHPWTLLVRMFAALTLHGAAALLVLARLRGEPLTIGALLGALGRLLLPIFATEIVLLCVVLVWLLPGALLGTVWPAAALLLLMGLWPIVVFSLAIPAVAVERLPPLSALRRSFELTHGVRSVVCLALIAAFLAGTVAIFAFAVVAVVLPASPLVRFNALLASTLLSDTFVAVLIAHLYGALRLRKEAAAAVRPD